MALTAVLIAYLIPAYVVVFPERAVVTVAVRLTALHVTSRSADAGAVVLRTPGVVARTTVILTHLCRASATLLCIQHALVAIAILTAVGTTRCHPTVVAAAVQATHLTVAAATLTGVWWTQIALACCTSILTRRRVPTVISAGIELTRLAVVARTLCCPRSTCVTDSVATSVGTVAELRPIVVTTRVQTTDLRLAVHTTSRSRRTDVTHTVATSIGAGLDLVGGSARTVRRHALIAVAAGAEELTIRQTARTLAVSGTIATVGTGYVLLPIVSGACCITTLTVVARTLVGIRRTLVTIRGRVRLTHISLDTSVGTVRWTIPYSGVRTGVDRVACTSRLIF